MAPGEYIGGFHRVRSFLPNGYVPLSPQYDSSHKRLLPQDLASDTAARTGGRGGEGPADEELELRDVEEGPGDEDEGLRDEEQRKKDENRQETQMRRAMINVIEATFESSFQIIIQLYIAYPQLANYKDNEIFTKQVFSVVTSLLSLTVSFTMYHRTTKRDGLSMLNAVPLGLALLFQVIARLTAFTVFLRAYDISWIIFIVFLIFHYLIVLVVLKFSLEDETEKLRMFVSTVACTFVYFRLHGKERSPQKKGTYAMQFWFHLLALVENVSLISVGLTALNADKLEKTILVSLGLVGSLGYLVGVVFLILYYKVFGHPWTCNNGPNLFGDESESENQGSSSFPLSVLRPLVLR